MNRIWIGLLLLATVGMARAEGSRDLFPSGATGKRAFLEYNVSGASSYAGIPRRNSLEVYARAGEVIALGSSAHGLGSKGGIRHTRPSGVTDNCSRTGAGRIADRAQELAGPNYPAGSNSSGFAPCTVPVTETGIWRVEFLGPEEASGNPSTTEANASWTQPVNNGLIAAWDVTVFSAGAVQRGRVWADYLPLNTGSNNSTNANLNVYVLSNEGYLFRQRQVIDPYGYIFFANNRGFLSSTTGNPVFKSITSSETGLQGGYSLHLPHLRDSGINVTHKIFFAEPAASLPSEADYWAGGDDWLRLPVPILPPQIEEVRFVGRDGTEGQAAGVSGGGGTFHFRNPASETLSVRVVIPLSSNGANVDRVLTGVAPPGTGSLDWDGLDGNGNPIYADDTLTYNFTATLFGGEIHFPFFDVERSQGLTVRRLNGPSSSQWPDDLLYWDHSLVAGSGGPVPLVNLGGLSSSATPAMSYTGTWGNNKGLDAWTYVPSDQPAFSSQVTVRTADLRIVKSADFQPVGQGGVVAYTLTVDNLSADTFAREARVQDIFAASLTGMSWTCEIVEPGLQPPTRTSRCLSASGSGNLDALVDLRGGARAVFRIRGTRSTAAGSTLDNTATVSRSADAADPDLANNTSTVSIGVVPGYAVSGHVYEDQQPNGVRDGAEDWAGGTPVWVSLVKDSGEVLQSQPVAAGAGAYAFAGVPAGAYRLLVTNANLASSVVQPAGFQFYAPSSGSLDLQVSNASVTDRDFALLRGGFVVIEGRVFEDNGQDSGIPHNGLQEGGESGLDGVRVQAVAAGAVLAEVLSAADGGYRLQLAPGTTLVEIVAQTPEGFLSISESAGDASGVDNPSPLDDRLSLTASPGGHYRGVDFGDIREPALAPDLVRSAPPGSMLYLPHTFTAHTSGSVLFTLHDPLPTPDIPGWDTRLFSDSNCNASFDEGEPALDSALSLLAGQQNCLLLRLFVPAGAPFDAQWRATLQAEMSYASATGTPLRSSIRSVQDLVRADPQTLVLLKAVDRDTAVAGDVLTYTLTYRNAGIDGVSDVEIRDATPAYTAYVGGSAVCHAPLPTGILECTASQVPDPAGVGGLVWRLRGSLPAGAEGRVEYRVTVDDL